MAEQISAAEAKQRIDVAWSDWIAAIESVPESRWSEPGVCGDWSIKDLLGHIAVWDAVMIKYLGICARGKDPGDSIDWQAINDEGFALRAGRSVVQQRAEMEESHDAMLRALTSDAAFDADILGGSTWRHYGEHADQVRAWR